MSTVDAVVALVLAGLAAVAVIVIGSLGVRVTRSTDDFLAASRTVRSRGERGGDRRAVAVGRRRSWGSPGSC